MVVLGVDVGGTKTHAVLADERGRVLGVGHAGGGNWETVGLDGARRALQSALKQALTAADLTADDIAASGYGLAGLDWPSDELRLEPVIAALGVSGPHVMVNDAFLPLRAGTADGVGVAAVAGTGTTVVGRNRAGRMARSFGMSYPFPDWGGAWDIVMAAVHAVAKAYLRMGPETALACRMLQATGCAGEAEMLEKLGRGQIFIGGEFAPQVIQAAQEGDAVAQSIVRRVGESIGANVTSVARRLEMLDGPFDLVASGGVFSSQCPLLYHSLLEAVRVQAPQVHLVHWQAPPVIGALLMALDLVERASPQVADRLVAGLMEALQGYGQV